MPTLKNPRHEAFAQALARGETADQAYQSAGYSENRGNATRLKANESVAARVDELMAEAAKLTLVTIDSITAEYDEARELARVIKQPATMVAASTNKAKLHGLMEEKQKHEGKIEVVITLRGGLEIPYGPTG